MIADNKKKSNLLPELNINPYNDKYKAGNFLNKKLEKIESKRSIATVKNKDMEKILTIKNRPFSGIP